MVTKTKQVTYKYIARLWGADYAALLVWLQKNIGKMVASKPIVTWEGEGWYMTLVQGNHGDPYCDIHFVNKKHLKLLEKDWVE